MKSLRSLLVWVVLGVLLAGSVLAVAAPTTELPPGLQIPDAARPGPDFNADRATEAYLALLSPEQRAQSDAYFEGGYWLQLWGLLYGLLVAWILLRSGLSRKMRDFGRRVSKRPWLATMVYVAQWVLVGSLLALPLTVYQGYFREHAYGLATQGFGDWTVDQLKGLLISLIIMPPVIGLLYAAVRKTAERWWIWATGGTFLLMLFFMMIAPVFLDPVFNDYKPLRQGEVRDRKSVV